MGCMVCFWPAFALQQQQQQQCTALQVWGCVVLRYYYAAVL